ncbi:MAG TPA: hypothetical protein VNJ51_02055 [Candidatus Dormibacteraeota bacterium]|nr:hypothetical protein [Candidatus Dormibacteraeota bacterium]
MLCAIPLALGAFIVLTQPAMGYALLFTGPGHVVIAIVAALELLGILSIHVILRDVT